jgi:hypothetical protein
MSDMTHAPTAPGTANGEQAGGCCDTATLGTCCAPQDKSSCCGAPSEGVTTIAGTAAPSTCGCR